MRIEQVIGRNIATERKRQGMTQAALGQVVSDYLDRAWHRQAVNAGEHGGRAFNAAELVAFSLALAVPMERLLTPPTDTDELTLTNGRTARYSDLTPDATTSTPSGQALRDVYVSLEHITHALQERTRHDEAVTAAAYTLQRQIETARTVLREERTDQ